MTIGLADIRAAADRIRPHVLRTPLRRSDWLSGLETVRPVRLKLEIVQPTSLVQNPRRVQRRACLGAGGARLVTASAGNHGRALAHACRILGLPLDRLHRRPRRRAQRSTRSGPRGLNCGLPRLRRSRARGQAPRARPAATFHLSLLAPRRHGRRRDDRLELFEDLPGLSAVVVPIGGGGLISGIGIAARALSPATRVIGVEVTASARLPPAWPRVG